MKMKEQDYQQNRLLLKESSLFSCLKIDYPQSQIHISNFGYIIVPHDTSSPVIKYYIKEQFYRREKEGFSLISSSGVPVPKILNTGDVQIEGSHLFFIEFENIRTTQPRYQEYNDMPIQGFAKLLSSIHSLDYDKSLVVTHGNPHYSNFYLTGEAKLGVFDFVSVSKTYIEYDFASVYFHSGYDDIFLEKLIGYHVFSDIIDYKRIYYYTMKKIIQNIKSSEYYSMDTPISLKKSLIMVKQKYMELDHI